MVKTVKKIILHPKHLTLENSLLFAIIHSESEYWLNPSWLLLRGAEKGNRCKSGADPPL
jgi:hypothetical protein